MRLCAFEWVLYYKIKPNTKIFIIFYVNLKICILINKYLWGLYFPYFFLGAIMFF